jgi:hypothetical protein
MTYCCTGLEKLIPPKGRGLGLFLIINQRGSRFFLEYRKDWSAPVSEATIQIQFCPFCGTKLTNPSS